MASCSKHCKHYLCAYCGKFNESLCISQNIMHPGLIFHPMLPLWHFDKYTDSALMNMAYQTDPCNQPMMYVEIYNDIIKFWLKHGKISKKQRDCICRTLVNSCFESR